MLIGLVYFSDLFPDMQSDTTGGAALLQIDDLAPFHDPIPVEDGITNEIRKQACVIFRFGFVQIRNIQPAFFLNDHRRRHCVHDQSAKAAIAAGERMDLLEPGVDRRGLIFR